MSMRKVSGAWEDTRSPPIGGQKPSEIAVCRPGAGQPFHKGENAGPLSEAMVMFKAIAERP
jgi:hypothetical protein